MVSYFNHLLHSSNIGKRFLKENKTGLLSESHVNKEIYQGIILLKNLAIVYKDNPLSQEKILEILMDNSSRLKPYYQELLSKVRLGNVKDSFKQFANQIGTKSSKNFATILSKLDRLNPLEFFEQLEVFQNMMMEIRTTEEMKQIERFSLLGTVISTVTVFALLINFVIVDVLLDTLSMLEHLYY